MDENIRIAYAEVFEILKNMDKNLVSKVPIEILESFKINRKMDFSSNIDKKDIFNKNNISREALSILAYLNLNYWVSCDKKQELENIYRKNESEEQERAKELYPIDIFKNKREKNSIAENNQLIEIQPQKWYQKILDFIKFWK